MEKINYWDLPKLLKKDSIRLVFTGDKKDLVLNSDEYLNWWAPTEKQYQQVEKEIDDLKYEGNGYKIYCYYDYGGYAYWEKEEQTNNYIQITISFDKNTVEIRELETFKKEYFKILDKALIIQEKYSGKILKN